MESGKGRSLAIEALRNLPGPASRKSSRKSTALTSYENSDDVNPGAGFISYIYVSFTETYPYLFFTLFLIVCKRVISQLCL